MAGGNYGRGAKPEATFGKAKLSDAPEIHELINSFDGKDVARKSFGEVCSNIRDYFIAQADGKIVGCVALDFIWADCAELRSLAVKPEHQGKGIGSRLVELATYEAKIMGVKKLIGFTKKPEFFRKFRFEVVGRESAPEDLKDILLLVHDTKCTHYPNCEFQIIMNDLKHIE